MNLRTIKNLTDGTRTKVIFLIIAALFGISMIAVSYCSDSDDKYAPFRKDSTEYLENRVENIISSATGSKNVDVLITFKDTKEQTEKSTVTNVFSYSTDKETNPNSGSEIAGVMIVCKGITSQKDFNTLKCAVATVLGISQNKIYIIGGEETK